MIQRSWRSMAPPAMAAIAVAAFGVWPTYRSSTETQERRANTQAASEQLQSEASSLTPLSLEAERIQLDLAAFDVLVPAEHDVAGFVIELDEIADRLGVELRDVVPSQPDIGGDRDPSTPRDWASIELNVRAVGEYGDFIRFAEEIARTDRLAVIDSIGITAGGNSSLVGDFRLRLFSNNDSPGELIARYVAENEENQP